MHGFPTLQFHLVERQEGMGSVNIGTLRAFALLVLLTLNPFTIAKGRAPSALDEVVIDKRTADDQKWSLGTEITVIATRFHTIVSALNSSPLKNSARRGSHGTSQSSL